MRFSVFSILLSAALLLPASAGTEHQEVSSESVTLHECEVTPSFPETARPKNIIFMIGDGMGSEQVWAAWLVNKGRLNIEQLPVTGFSRTTSASHTVTDSAASGTALACGQKTTNGHIGQTPQGEKLSSLLTRAEEKKMSTGLVVTKDITDATPAAFYAHTNDRRKAEAIAAYLPECGADFVFGGGRNHFSAQQLEAMRQKGMDIRLCTPGNLPPRWKRGSTMPEEVGKALTALEQNPQGFFLMVEGSQIDTACHSNNLKGMVEEMLDFDQAIGVVLRWMQQNPDTLLVITADHQTGGLSILDGDKEAGTVKGCFTTTGHNGLIVPVYAIGPGASVFGGIHENTEIHDLLQQAMDSVPREE